MRTLLFGLGLCALLVGSARANNTLDSGPASCTVGASTSSCTVSYTTASGSTMLCIGTGLYNNVAISTLSFNGSTTGWTLIKRQNDGTHAATTELECKASPATSTTANAVVTMSTPPAQAWGFIVFSLSGTKTASFSEGAAGATDLVGGTPNAATGNTVNVTTTVDGDWVIDVTVMASGTSIAPGGSQTQIGSTLIYTGGSSLGELLVSYHEVHPTATVAQSWTWTGGSAASSIAAGAIEPASFSPPGSATTAIPVVF